MNCNTVLVTITNVNQTFQANCYTTRPAETIALSMCMVNDLKEFSILRQLDYFIGVTLSPKHSLSDQMQHQLVHSPK